MESIKYIKVVSSQILEVGWDPLSHELRVLFKGNGGATLYSYANVPGNLVAGLIFSKSCGKFLNEFIKPAHQCAKLDREGKVERVVFDPRGAA